MKLSQPVKILVGLATAWPIVYMGIFLLFFVAAFVGAAVGGVPPVFIIALFPLHLLTMLWMAGLLAFYIVYLFKTDRVPEDRKALWAVVIFLGNVVAMPVFFFLHIWPEPEGVEDTGAAS